MYRIAYILIKIVYIENAKLVYSLKDCTHRLYRSHVHSLKILVCWITKLFTVLEKMCTLNTQTKKMLYMPIECT